MSTEKRISTLYRLTYVYQGLVHFDFDVLRKQKKGAPKAASENGVHLRLSSLAYLPVESEDESKKLSDRINNAVHDAVKPYLEALRDRIEDRARVVGPDGRYASREMKWCVEAMQAVMWDLVSHQWEGKGWMVVPLGDWSLMVYEDQTLESFITMVRRPLRDIIDPIQERVKSRLLEVTAAWREE